MSFFIFASFPKGKSFIFVHHAAPAHFNDYSPMPYCTPLIFTVIHSSINDADAIICDG